MDDRRHHVAERGAAVVGAVLALDQDAFGVLVGEVGADRLVGAARLAGAVVVVDRVLVPIEPPMATARITKASHPKMAFFRC